MTQTVKWRYRTVKARPNTLMAGEHPDHKFEFKIRTDDLTPHDALQEFQARCSCGWVDVANWTVKRLAHTSWEKHLGQALQQLELAYCPDTFKVDL